MTAIATKRCPACREVALLADAGRVRVVGETRYLEVRPNGDTVFRCGFCGGLVVWERQPGRPTASGAI